jgi:hypothetical protein
LLEARRRVVSLLERHNLGLTRYCLSVCHHQQTDLPARTIKHSCLVSQTTVLLVQPRRHWKSLEGVHQPSQLPTNHLGIIWPKLLCLVIPGFTGSYKSWLYLPTLQLFFLHTYLAWTLAINKAGCLEELRALHSAQKYLQPSPPGAGRVEFFISYNFVLVTLSHTFH